MQRIMQNSIIPFLRQHWWIWLSLFVVTIVVMIIGPSVVGNFIYGVFEFIFGLGLIFLAVSTVYKYTLGKGIIGVWGGLRIIGILGVIFFSVMVAGILTVVPWDEIMSKPEHEANKASLFFFVSLGLFCFFLIGIGELLLHLHSISDKLSQRVAQTVEQQPMPSRKEEMICPRCAGKGYVDSNDIKRLNIEMLVDQGPCTYCDAEGYVPRGITKTEDPAIEPEEYSNEEYVRFLRVKGEYSEECFIGFFSERCHSPTHIEHPKKKAISELNA